MHVRQLERTDGAKSAGENRAAESGRRRGNDSLQADPEVSESWNAYAYAENSPVSRADPTGLLSRLGMSSSASKFAAAVSYIFDDGGSYGDGSCAEQPWAPACMLDGAGSDMPIYEDPDDPWGSWDDPWGMWDDPWGGWGGWGIQPCLPPGSPKNTWCCNYPHQCCVSKCTSKQADAIKKCDQIYKDDPAGWAKCSTKAAKDANECVGKC